MKRKIWIIGLIISALTLFGLARNADAYWLTKVKNWLIQDSQIENCPIGAVTPAEGTFTTLEGTTVGISGGVIDGTTIGATTPSTGAFTTLSVSGAGTLHETSFSDSDITNVGDIALDTITADDASSFTISSDWTNAGNTIADLGIVTTTDVNGGSIDGTPVGANSASTGAFNSLTTTKAVTTDETAIAEYSQLTVSGTWGAAAPSFGLASYNKILGADIAATDSYMAGVVGLYGITGTNATTYPACGVLGWIADETTTADAAFVALIDGDTGVTTAGAAYAVRYLNSTPGSGFDYGLDLYSTAIGAYNAVSYGAAEIRFSNGATINAGSAATRAAVNTALGARTAGSFYYSSAGKAYLCIDDTGSDTSWERVTTSAAD